MQDIFGTLMILSPIALVVGLINPRWLRLPSRMHVAGIFSTTTIAFFVLFAVTTPTVPKPDTSANTASTTAEVSRNGTKPEQLVQSATQAQNAARAVDSSADGAAYDKIIDAELQKIVAFLNATGRIRYILFSEKNATDLIRSHPINDTADDRQNLARAMADTIASQNDLYTLTVWASSLRIKPVEWNDDPMSATYYDAVTFLRNEIGSATNDFAAYRDNDKSTGLAAVLGTGWGMLETE